MLSRSQQKLLRKLLAKKYRWQHRLFIAEGRKVVGELLEEALEPQLLMAERGSSYAGRGSVELEPDEFKRWSSLEQADEVLGVFPFPELISTPSDLVVILDGIKDPGNLGSIIRTCDWFGVTRIFCTTGTVDAFNAKSVQSSMGSIARVGVSYHSAEEILHDLAGHRLLCADMEGTSVTDIQLSGKTAVVMGSESHGPSDFWKENAERITIPRKGSSKTESLNVAIATALVLGQLSLR